MTDEPLDAPVSYAVSYPAAIITYGTYAEAAVAAKQLAFDKGRPGDVVAVKPIARLMPPPPANDPEPEPLRYA